MSIQPKEFNIFISLHNHFRLVRLALVTLRDCADDPSQAWDAAYSQIQNMECQGDQLLDAVVRQLDRQSTDCPPRESTRRLFYRQDRILDAAKLLAGLLAAYRIGVLPGAALQLMATIGTCAEVLGDAMRAFGEGQHFLNPISKLAELKKEADQLYIAGIRELAEGANDPCRLFMLNKIYGMLERIVNLFEDCVQALEDTALKTLAELP